MDISVTKHDAVSVITWNEGENRINFDSLARLSDIFAELADEPGPQGVVWTGAGKFFSNGLDLERFGTDADEMFETIRRLDHLFGQILVHPGYVIAAINGHAFAGGAMLTQTADYRIMRSDRGYWAVNEVDIGMHIPPNMADVVMCRMPLHTALEAMNTARRYSAEEAVAAHIVERAVPGDEVLSQAIEFAAHVAPKNRKAIAIHKEYVFGDLARRLKSV